MSASTSAPAVTANFQNVSNLTPGSVIKINNTTITLGSTTDSALVAQINAQNGGAGITGLHAAMVGNKFTLFVTPASIIVVIASAVSSTCSQVRLGLPPRCTGILLPN